MKQIFLVLATSTILFACHNGADQAAIEAAKQEAVDSVNTAAAIKQQVLDSIKADKEAARERKVANASAAQSTSSSSSAATTTTTEKKKGWSHTAKGAVVGAGAGAITGAVVNKHDRVKGAAIGTLIGAGVGAGTGAIVDNAKKKKEARQ